MQIKKNKNPIFTLFLGLLLTSCVENSNRIEIKFLAGSDLAQFCQQAADRLESTRPKLADGTSYFLTCDIKGSGDVVTEVLGLTKQLTAGTIQPEAPAFPSLISVDGEIYQNQLRFEIDKIVPGQNYIPELTDSPLLAYSPMVFMTTEELASGLEKLANPFTALAEVDNHQELDPQSLAIPLNYVHTAPTRSNSGLQTLVAQFAALANKEPRDLTIADVREHQEGVKEIQEKITRYGTSTGSLARSMRENGPFWASVGSMYESLVIDANVNAQANNSPTKFKAVYPEATFSSNIRAILPNTPWMSPEETAAAKEIISFLRKPEIQQIAVDLGLRPGIPGVPLGNKFSENYGVKSQPQYIAYRPPQPEVVAEMLKVWQEYAKKDSRVVILVDVSGSMKGTKLASVQNSLLNYIQNLGEKEEIVLISFSNRISKPLVINGTNEGKNLGLQFINNLRADGGTRLYDGALFARNWLRNNLRTDAINAVLILTDGRDEGSNISLDGLSTELENSSFESAERIAFFTIGYGEGNQGFNADALQTIAQLNGGYYRQGDPATISQLMADLQIEF